MYALGTLHITTWGTRDASNFVKDPNAVKAVEDEDGECVVKIRNRNTDALRKYRRSNVIFMRNIHTHYTQPSQPDIVRYFLLRRT